MGTAGRSPLHAEKPRYCSRGQPGPSPGLFLKGEQLVLTQSELWYESSWTRMATNYLGINLLKRGGKGTVELSHISVQRWGATVTVPLMSLKRS